MLKYVSKFAMDILPSVAATIIGAYIVNHYITSKPAANAPVASVSRNDGNASAASARLANLPGPGITAKGISEKAMLEKTAGEKPAVAEKSAPEEKHSDKPAETAGIPAETRRHQPGPREKAMVKSAAVSAVEPAVATEEHRDANELARAAIERLRGEGSPRPQEANRILDPPRTPDTARVVSTSPRQASVVSSPPPLPPAIMVSKPAIETSPATVDVDNNLNRPTPPAEIPAASIPAGPLDLSTEAAGPARREHPNVAEEMLLAAKSVFQAVLPK